MSRATIVRRALLASVGGGSGYAAYKAKFDPPQIIWDLDETILCSITPMPPNANDKPSKYPTDPTRSFLQIDDDFPFENYETPNTRTFWRPGARTALQICRVFSDQHVFTTAQGTYAANVLAELDPRLFDKVIHRDLIPSAVKKGKDIRLITNRLDRAVLFDDRTKNFVPQNGENGVHVVSYNKPEESDMKELKEVARLVGIAFLALMATDVRDVVKHFRSEEHMERFVQDNIEDPTKQKS